MLGNRILTSAVALGLAAAVWAGGARRARPTPPPPVSERQLSIPGLGQPVEVRRDRWGIPHVYARSTHDLFLAQGFVAAQDRLFQMEMWRRAGEGRLAEVLGPSALARDRFARLFRYRGDMAAEWAAYGPDTRAIVTAFVAGVNAYIAMAGDSLPPEFTLLGFRPEPWSDEVPLVRATGLSGVSNGASEVLRAQLVAALGAARVDALLPADPARALDPAPGLDLAGIGAASLGGFASAFADVAYDRLEGSNNWVVDGRRSATGRPLLANDPHRVITNPAVRYITHLVAPGWDVIGAGEPASPGVAIGHNDRIAFGLTVVGMDQQDVYVEALGACPGAPEASLDCYRHQGAWHPVERVTDTIRVKGARARVEVLRFTRHGPLVAVDSARRRGFAIRSVHAEPGTAAYLGSLALDRARDWPAFQAAMTRWRMPSENMLYADVDGNIGWVAAGLMPRRHWSGLLPVPGDGTHEWSGFVDGMALPRTYNPAAGFVATANHNILPPGYDVPLAYEWASRYRIDRITEVLRQDRRFSVADFQALQHDDYSKLAEALVPRLAAAAERLGRAGDAEVQRLVAWDRHMARAQVAPTLFAAWAPAAYRRAVAQALADQPALARTLGARPEYEWLERRLAMPGPAGDSALVLAVDDAVAELTRRFGPAREGWRWGAVHVARFAHPLSRRYDLPDASRGGDANTVYATGGRDFLQQSGASYRQVIDLADFDRSVVTNVPGQSGDPRSPHYGDLLPRWGRDAYIPLAYSRAAVERATVAVLRLTPAPRR